MREDNRITCEKLVRKRTNTTFELRDAPCCRMCPFFQTEFRYRKCLFVKCPYGKETIVFRRSPLDEERAIDPRQPVRKRKAGQGGKRKNVPGQHLYKNLPEWKGGRHV